MPRVSIAAADDCLTAPTGDKADGQHWRYHLENGRRCWYLKGSTAAVRNNAEDRAPRQPNQASSAWNFAQPAPPKLTPRRGTGPVPRASTEAFAADEPGAATKPQPAATPGLVRTQRASSFDDGQEGNAAIAPSWQPLDSADMNSLAPAAAAPPPDEPAAASDPAASAPPTDTSVVKPPPPVAPIRKLLMVVVGALSLSGLLASALYRLSRVGRRRRRNRNWQSAITRARRNRDKPRAKSKMVYAGSRSSRAAKRSKTAPAPAAKQVPPPTMPTPAVAVVPEPTAAATPPAQFVDLPASRVTEVAPPRAAATPSHPAEPLPDLLASVPSETIDPAAELLDLLGSHAAKRAAQPVVDVPPVPASPPLEATPPRLPLASDPETELADLLASRFAPPSPSAKPVTTPARQQRPSAPVNMATPKVADPIAALANLLEAKESERAARFGNAEPFRRSSPPPPMPPTAKPVDPAAGLFDLLAARAASTMPPQASAPRPVKTVQSDKVTPPRRKKVAASVGIDSAPVGRPPAAAEIVAAVAPPEAEVVNPDRHEVDRWKAGSPNPGAPKIRTDKTRTDKIVAPKIVISKTATPKAGKTARRTIDEITPRRRGTELPPLPPALMLEPANDGPTPPLDFIPRPQVLRPRMRDIRQDESLDGVQDILARLGKHN